MLQYVAADWSLRPHTDRNPGVVVTPQACHGGTCGFIPVFKLYKQNDSSFPDRQCSNFEFCVWKAVSSVLSHHPQEILLVQFSLCVDKSGIKHRSFILESVFTESNFF